MLQQVRAWRPTDRQVAAGAVASLVGQVVLVVTGGAVRLTDSGLGCPTWPPCADNAFVATPQQGIHGLVENSNRFLAGLLAVLSVVVLLTVWRQRPRRPILVRLAAVLVGGIAAQAVLGGITVLTGLNPLMVMAHFLLSMVLVATATVLVQRSREGDGPPILLVRLELVLLARVLVGVAAATLVAGTVVTGSGPHSGDKNATHRLPFEITTVTQLHADLVFLLLGLTVALLLGLRAVDAPRGATRRVLELLAIALAQGTIGYIQYFTRLPIFLVGLHMLGATLVWVAAVRIPLGLRERATVPVAQEAGPAGAARGGGSRAAAGSGTPAR